MKPLRLMVWHWGRRGGGPRYMLELTRALMRRDDVSVHLSYSRQAELADAFAGLGLPGLPVDTYGGLAEAALATARLPWLVRRFGRYLRAAEIDVVFCAMGHLWNIAAVPAIRPAGARYILAVHDAVAHPGEESRLRVWALRRELALTDGVVALTAHVRDQLAAVHGYPADRMTVLPHGAFDFKPTDGPRRHPGGRPFRLLFLGRILPYKGVDLLLEAYGALRRRFGEQVVLRIAGAGDLAPYAQALAACPDVSLANRWLSEDEIGEELAAADLLLLPYREASQSGPAASACAAALPAAATPVGGLTEQVRHGETGLLAAAVSGAALADAAAAIIADPALYARLSAGALAQARGPLSWEPIADGLVRTARRMLAQNQGRGRKGADDDRG